MNLKTIMLTMIVAGVTTLAGCSSPSILHQKDGVSTMTPDKPTYNKDTGFYEYQKDGKTVQINKDDVKSIEEVK